MSVSAYGAHGDGIMDDTGAIQAAVDACGTGGGTVNFPAGTYVVSRPIKLPAGNTDLLTLSGHGATIRLKNTTPRFLVWNRRAMHLTFRKFCVEGFTVDAQNLHPASSSGYSVLGFDSWTRSAYRWSSYLNIEDVTVKDCTVLNVATDPAQAWNARCINIYTGQAGGGEVTWNHIQDVLVQNCRCEGGAAGVMIWGSGVANLSVTIDRVYIRDCWHDAMTTITNSVNSSNYHIGQYAQVGRAEITNCYGNRSGDVGVEIDQASEGLVENCRMDNSNWNAYYYTDFSVPLRQSAPQTTFRNCDSHMYLPQNNSGGQCGWGVSDEGYTIGVLNIENCTHEVDASTGGSSHRAIYVNSSVNMDTLNIDGLAITNGTSQADSTMVLIEPTTGTVNLSKVTIDGNPNP